MKISCQSCHSKYNVADEKVQGKIVKIRCRKCGATIVVNASGVAANGSVPAPPATAPEAAVGAAGAAGAAEGEWHVSVADNDQRTMGLAELVAAYNAGVVAQDTFVWTEGMSDWRPLGEVDAVVSALHVAAELPSSAPAATGGGFGYGLPAPAAPSPAYEPAPPAAAYGGAPAYEGGFAKQAQSTQEPEPKRAAVVKREARARDLFATRSGEEMHMAPPDTQALAAPFGGDDSRLTGQRNENSVLFSLDHLTKTADQPPTPQPGSARLKDDSGLIDLRALSAKAESMRPPTLHDANALSSPLGLAPPLGFAAPLGAPLGGFGPGSDVHRKSKLPLVIGLVAGVALLLVFGILIGLKIGGGATPGPVATANAAPRAPASAAAEPTASTSASAASATASPAASASASAAALAAKPHAYGGNAFKPVGAAKPPGAVGSPGGASAGGASAGGTGGGSAAGAPAGASTAPPKKGDCGCNGDLMCMMKCSTH
jgi:predicted Zn finger-like uncharacterized protein